MCILRLRSIVMAKNKRLQVQSHVVFIMNEHFNNYNPWWPREDIVFCPSCPCCFADHPRIHTDFLLIPRCDNPWKDADFAFSLWAVLYVIMTPLYWLIDSLFPSYTWRLHKYINIFTQTILHKYINIFTHKQYYKQKEKKSVFNENLRDFYALYTRLLHCKWELGRFECFTITIWIFTYYSGNLIGLFLKELLP